MTNLNYKVRKATEKDYFAVNSLLREVYKSEKQTFPNVYKKVPQVLISYDTFSYTLRDRKSIILVAEVKEIVVGVIDISIEENEGDDLVQASRRSSIEELFVTKIYAGKGIEQDLLSQAEQLLAKKHISQLAAVIYNFDNLRSDLLKNNKFEPYTVRYLKDI